MTFTVKALLTKPGCGGQSQQEIRRFAVDEDVGTSFVYLHEKITSVFPSLKNKSVELYWKDSENDLIAFSSDEELTEAISTVTDGVFKVFVVVKGEGQAEAPKPDGVLHPRVSCDGCEGPVRGIRYKCQVCPDYDLCSACKSTGLHSEHQMTAIERPVPCPFFGAGTPMFGMAHIPPSPFGFCPPPPPHGMPPPPPLYRFCNENPENPEEMRKQRRAYRRWLRAAYGGDHCSMWKKGKKERKEEKKQEKMEQKAERKASKEKAKADKAEDSKEMPDGEKDSSSSSSSSDGEGSPTGDYLQSVGQTVAAMLDPLGIDVQVDVEHRGKRKHCHRGGRGGPWGWHMRGHHGGPGWGFGRGGGWGFGRGGFCHMGSPCGGSGFSQTQAAAGQGPVPQGPPPPPSQCPSAKDVDTNSETGELRSFPSATVIIGDKDVTMSSYPEANGWTLVASAEEPGMEDATKGIEKLQVSSGEEAAGNSTDCHIVENNDQLETAMEKMRSMGYIDNDDYVAALLLDNNYDIGRTLDAINSKK